MFDFRKIILDLTFCGCGLISCKKGSRIEPATTRADLTRDSLFLYAKQIYIWNDAIPSYEDFKPRNFTSAPTDLENYWSEVIALSQYKINPVTGKPYEYFAGGKDSKYWDISPIISGLTSTVSAPHGNLAIDLESFGNDFGLRITAYSTPNSQDYGFFVTAVFENSPADKAGMFRGDRITGVNGIDLNTNFSTDLSLVNNELSGAQMLLNYIRYNNGIAESNARQTSFQRMTYQSYPVYVAIAIDVGVKKIGHLCYARFSALSYSRPALDKVFTNFRNGNVTDLVIDLRYNSGGYINTLEYLLNQVASFAAHSAVMSVDHCNSAVQLGSAKNLLSNHHFSAHRELFNIYRMIN